MGDELVLSCDGSGNIDSGTRLDELYSYQSHRGADILELYHIDYSYKAIKTVLSFEQQVMKNAQLNLVTPLQYGAMPDLGRYSQPDGPVPNWSELMPLGRIDEARAAQEEAMEHAVRDMVFVAEGMIEAGADGLDFDTAGAAGDADFLAALRAVEEIRGRTPTSASSSAWRASSCSACTASSSSTAGAWPACGRATRSRWPPRPASPCSGRPSTSTPRKSVAWNVARALTIVKPCVARVATIPVHMNVGMGVGGVPMTPYPPADAVARVSRAMREVGRLDGL